MASWAFAQEDSAELDPLLPAASSCGLALLLSGLVATTSLLATVRFMWPAAFLLCSLAAAFAASRKLEDEDSRVTISYMARARASRQSSWRPRGRIEIEGLAYPKEKKEWIYPSQ